MDNNTDEQEQTDILFLYLEEGFWLNFFSFRFLDDYYSKFDVRSDGIVQEFAI